MQLTKKVLVDRPVDDRIAAMVRFVRKLEQDGLVQLVRPLSNDDLVKSAESLWDVLHGED